MLAYRLVRLIETHAERLAKSLLAKLRANDKCPDFTKVPAQEFEQRVYEVYDHLGEWLLGKKEEDIARRYTEIGMRRQKQGDTLYAFQVAAIYETQHKTKEALVEYTKELHVHSRDYLRAKYCVQIGECSAEQLKKELGAVVSASDSDKERTLEIVGKHLIDGSACAVQVSSGEVREALEPIMSEIVTGIQRTGTTNTDLHCRTRLGGGLLHIHP